jgi:methylated-DNA-[protein]-cysteine S-methyltransferase
MKLFSKKTGHRVKPGNDDLSVGRREVPPEFGWIATISKPIFRASIKLVKWSLWDLEPAMTAHSFAVFDTAIGRCGIVWGERGISGVQLPMGSEDKTRARIRQRYGDLAEAPPSAPVQSAIDGIVELLAGKPNDLADVVLDLDGVPEFNRGVYDIARSIPPGKTLTYGDIAKRLGGVELSRDVGQALGRNPCPIVVPCHRVLAAGGKPGGFSANGGVVTKLKMLAIEGAVVNHTPSLFD